MKAKQLLSVLLALLMVFSITACGGKTPESAAGDTVSTEAPAEATGDNQIPDGIYAGEGTGKGGTLKLEVKIENDTITEINVLENKETAGFADAAGTVASEIIRLNNPKVDGVTGCTLTSNATIEAVLDALSKAGATPDMLKAIDVEPLAEVVKEDVEETYDVVVIGAGGAGLTAAIEANADGAKVLVLEKMPMAGGNTLISGAEYAAPNNWIQEKEGIEDSPAQMAQDMLNGGDNIADPELVKTVSEHALEDAVWLRDEVGVVWEDELMMFGGHSVKRSLVPNGASGQEIIAKELAYALKQGIPVYYDTPAKELITDDSGRVVGVKAEGPDKNYTINATKGVVIASGGFGSNIEMRKKYNPEVDERVGSTNTVGSTGDGVIMAEAVGANLVGMEHIQTYPICDPLTGTLLYFDDSRLYGHSLIVNKEGQRFVQELDRRDVMSMAIIEQTGGVCYELLDETGFVDSKIQENHAGELEYLYANDLLVKADTIEEAAAFFDIDIENFKATIAEYNGFVENGEDTQFGKKLLTQPIEKGPFYILKASPAVHHTMGGIQINTNAEVINTDNQVIPGLFAAGEVTGGIHGTNRLGSCALADITVFGRIAGQSAAGKAE